MNLWCLEATNVALDNVNEGPKLNAKRGTLLGAYTVLEVVVKNLLKPRGQEFGRTFGFRSFNGIADKNLDFDGMRPESMERVAVVSEYPSEC